MVRRNDKGRENTHKMSISEKQYSKGFKYRCARCKKGMNVAYNHFGFPTDGWLCEKCFFEVDSNYEEAVERMRKKKVVNPHTVPVDKSSAKLKTMVE